MSRKFKIVAALLILFFGWIVFAPFLAGYLIIEKPLKKADAILILSGSSVFKERTHKAAQIYKSGVAKKILLSDDGVKAGWSQTEQRNPPFVYLAKRELIAQGVAENDIEILPGEVTGTIWEARNLEKKLAKENWKSVLLVTSPYHTKRALWIFQQVCGKNADIGIVSVSVREQTLPPWIWWLSIKGWKDVAGEYVKIFVYWVYY